MKIAILDGNNLAYRIFSQFSESRAGLLTNSVGLPTTIIFGFLRSLSMLAERTSFDRIVVCWDVSGSKFRKKIYPEYKAHRVDKDMQDYYDELDACREYMKVFGFNQAVAKGIEADDVVAWLSKRLIDKKHKVVIISDDKDYFQLIKRHIRIFRPIKDEFVNKTWVENEFGVPPKFMALLQALIGDKVDNIPGIRGIGPVTGSKLISTYGTDIDSLITNCEHEKWGPIIKEKAEELKIYYRLTKLRIRNGEYEEWERVRLKKCLREAMDEKKPTLKRVIRLANDLEFRKINVPFILKRIGISVKGNVKPREAESEIIV